MLLDRNHLLLGNEPVPATERLRVLCGVSIISRHVFAHNFCGVAGNVEARLETVLQLHTRHGLCADRVPSAIIRGNVRAVFSNERLVRHLQFLR